MSNTPYVCLTVAGSALVWYCLYRVFADPDADAPPCFPLHHDDEGTSDVASCLRAFTLQDDGELLRAHPSQSRHKPL